MAKPTSKVYVTSESVRKFKHFKFQCQNMSQDLWLCDISMMVIMVAFYYVGVLGNSTIHTVLPQCIIWFIPKCCVVHSTTKVLSLVCYQVSDLIIPTADTVRQRFFLDVYISHEIPLLFVGPTGTGKSAITNNYLVKLPKEKFVHACLRVCVCVLVLVCVHVHILYVCESKCNVQLGNQVL